MITDDDLLYHAGTIKLNWKKKVDPRNYKRIVSKYGTTREGLIQWQKETSYPIIPDEEEIIHRDEWDLETLNGATEEALYHKHYDVWWDYIYKNHKPQHKILTVFECSNQKPYFHAKPPKYYADRWSDYSDFASIAYGIQPWEFVNMYPSRWDEWDHFRETPHMQHLYSEKTKERILEYHKHFPQYEKMIFICQSRHPQSPVD